jgi:hypothetical protein
MLLTDNWLTGHSDWPKASDCCELWLGRLTNELTNEGSEPVGRPLNGHLTTYYSVSGFGHDLPALPLPLIRIQALPRHYNTTTSRDLSNSIPLLRHGLEFANPAFL